VVRAIPRDRSPTDDELTRARGALERAEALVPRDGFLAGEAITLADLYLAPQLDNCAGKAPELLDGLPAIAGWMDLIGRRPSFRQTEYVPG
jgi:glutathione S-transferase